jgi:hypothetical protein
MPCGIEMLGLANEAGWLGCALSFPIHASRSCAQVNVQLGKK